jgi:transposase-like protein
MPRAYSAAFRKEMIQKLRAPRGPSAVELAEKVGVHHGTLSRWLKEATTLHSVPEQDDERKPSVPSRVARRPEDWPPEEKLRAPLCQRA